MMMGGGGGGGRGGSDPFAQTLCCKLASFYH